MNYGEQLGMRGGEQGGSPEAPTFGAESLPQPDILTENTEKLAELEGNREQLPDYDPQQMGNAAVKASEYGGAPEMGEVTNEAALPIETTEETILSTETGSIEDKDGVTPEEANRIEHIMKIPDLNERTKQYELESRRFLVGRYADRAYLRGDKS